MACRHPRRPGVGGLRGARAPCGQPGTRSFGGPANGRARQRCGAATVGPGNGRAPQRCGAGTVRCGVDRNRSTAGWSLRCDPSAQVVARGGRASAGVSPSPPRTHDGGPAEAGPPIVLRGAARCCEVLRGGAGRGPQAPAGGIRSPCRPCRGRDRRHRRRSRAPACRRSAPRWSAADPRSTQRSAARTGSPWPGR